ncbi:hypothetical protein ONE63_008142 [Megalurothrips usitatus]|uniref:Reverse transcriptase domain-containing protein n=1 Tax=Megalurothrips usitatus TaxID=439358 RepID=A0AAV7XK93_9NEOP|nr:hypothetical protein ONE63_008142 [Megalurothrips usitatus]
MIATSFSERLVFHNQIPIAGPSHHDLLIAVFSFKVEKFKKRTVTFRDFKALDLEKFRKDVTNAPWHVMFPLQDVNAKLEFFYEQTNALFDKHAPFKTVTLEHRPYPWITREIKDLMKERDNMYKTSRRLNDRHFTAVYKKFNNRVKSQVRDAKRAANAPSAEALNKHYTSVKCLNAERVRETIAKYEGEPVPVTSVFHFKHVYFEDLQKSLSGVSANSKGKDGISALMLKPCLVEVSPAILHISNYSLQSGCFPDTWKVANVKPIPKSAGAAVPKDFRPISLLCTLGKMLEKIVHGQLTEFLDKNSLLDPNQSGFKPGHSTSTALLKVTGDVRENIDKRLLSLLVLYDFSNAFPSVDHELLIAKLRLFGLAPSVLDWFRSYLTNRAQRVVNGDDISSLIPLLFGVPQGSVLGPLLYSLYVNDIGMVFRNSSYHMYADDLQNYVSFCPAYMEKAVNIINQEATELVRYAESHNLTVNNSKTKVIVIGNHKLIKKLPVNRPAVVIDGDPVPYSETVVDLGVTVDQFLNWEAHARGTWRKGYAALHGLIKHRGILPRQVRKHLVEALVSPIINYGNTVTIHMLVKSAEQLQRLMNACARFVLDLRKDCHISVHIKNLNWLNVKNRMQLATLVLLMKVLKFNIPHYLYAKICLASDVRTRLVRTKRNQIRTPQHRTDKGRGAFWIHAPLLWNPLPGHILNCNSVPAFKNATKLHLLNQQNLVS